jgi:hypothetical protein
VQPFRGFDCITDHYLVVAKVVQRLSVNNQAVQKFGMERFNLRELNDVEAKEKYQVKIPNKLDDDDDDMVISRAWESIRI